MSRLAVLILTYNEEANIEDCIRSVAFADEIVVIDSGSTDRTVELAQRLEARVYTRAMTGGFAGQRNYALEKTECEWVLYLDADERIVPELGTEICAVVRQGDLVAYEIPRNNYVFGQHMKYGGFHTDYSLRLYPRTEISWTGLVHEQAHVGIARKRLNHAMIHHTYTDWDRYFIKFNSYTTLMSRRMASDGKHAHFSDIVFRPVWAFLRVYLFQSGWRDGKMGFVMAAFHAFYTMTKYVKLYFSPSNGERVS